MYQRGGFSQVVYNFTSGNISEWPGTRKNGISKPN